MQKYFYQKYLNPDIAKMSTLKTIFKFQTIFEKKLIQGTQIFNRYDFSLDLD